MAIPTPGTNAPPLIPTDPPNAPPAKEDEGPKTKTVRVFFLGNGQRVREARGKVVRTRDGGFIDVEVEPDGELFERVRRSAVERVTSDSRLWPVWLPLDKPKR